MFDKLLASYHEVWNIDFEFVAAPGNRPVVVCMVAREMKTGRTIRLWQNELGPTPPFRTDERVLFVAYYASAEIGCFLALGWPVPPNILDLFTEFRALTNGKRPVAGNSLLGAMAYHNLPGIGVGEKQELRQLIMRGGPWSDDERAAILDYCETDVAALDRLLPTMALNIDLPRATLRGKYMATVARIEFAGVPIDTETLRRIEHYRDAIKSALIVEIDKDYGVYDGLTFKYDRFAAYLERKSIPWPHDDNGRLKLDDDTFRGMERQYPEIAPLRGLRSFLSETRLADLPFGADDRNRALLSPFGSSTGRNQPSTTKYIFGLPAWYRSLIKPPPGYGLAYIDWSQQEFGIGAALSGDEAMLEAYKSGDPYLAFAKQAGLAPPEATKATHKAARDRAKSCILGTQYGMGEQSLAERMNGSVIEARELLSLHRKTYKTFWAWSDGAISYAMLRNKLWTVFGWPLHVGPAPNSRSLGNFLMQANGAEMLRLACILGVEAGIEICAPVHDALLIAAPLDVLDDHVARMQAIMAEASRIVLGGFQLNTDCEIVRYPDRYMDPRGEVMWDKVMRLIDDAEAEDLPDPATPILGQVPTDSAGSSIPSLL